MNHRNSPKLEKKDRMARLRLDSIHYCQKNSLGHFASFQITADLKIRPPPALSSVFI
jgi:hypothetical protein